MSALVTGPNQPSDFEKKKEQKKKRKRRENEFPIPMFGRRKKRRTKKKRPPAKSVAIYSSYTGCNGCVLCIEERETARTIRGNGGNETEATIKHCEFCTTPAQARGGGGRTCTWKSTCTNPRQHDYGRIFRTRRIRRWINHAHWALLAHGWAHSNKTRILRERAQNT